MDIEGRMDVPRKIDILPVSDQVKRLHHQLGVVYGRVFLTGDWEGEEDTDKKNDNLFEDVRTMTDPAMLADDIDNFLQDVKETIKTPVYPNDIKESVERHNFNRRLFAESLQYIRDILRYAQTAGGAHVRTEMMKVIDENIHYFRDLSIQGGYNETGNTPDEVRATEGLKRITNALAALFEIGVIPH